MSAEVSPSKDAAVLAHSDLHHPLGALSYSPGLPPESGGPESGGNKAALGALWIITGILQISLDTILSGGLSSFVPAFSPLWMGALSLFFGLCCVLVERFPSPALVLLTGLLRLAVISLSMTAYMWFSACARRDFDRITWETPVLPTGSPADQATMLERYEEGRDLLRTLSASLHEALVVLFAVSFCVGTVSPVLSFEALFVFGRRDYKPLPEETKATAQESPPS